MISRVLFITLLFYSITLSAQTKRAIVIGLGQQEDSSWSKINGDSDIPYIKTMLYSSGFNRQNIVTLVNEKATKKKYSYSF
jgi:hypothetical protein